MLRPISWLLSFGLHAGLLIALIGITGGAALEAGSGNDQFVVEQGIALEGIAKLGDAQETIETVDVAPQQTTERPLEEIKPNLANVITSTDGPDEDEVAAKEPPPIQDEKPDPVPVQEQAPQVATFSLKSSGAAQHGGNATLRLAYLGEVRKTLERSKVNPRIHRAGTVLIAFTVGPSGRILSREVRKTSGSKLLDEAALAAIDKAAPFPPMPHDVAQGPLEVQVPFQFVAH